MSTHTICFRAAEVLLMSTHNICFCAEIREMICGYPLLSGALIIRLPDLLLVPIFAEKWLHLILDINILKMKRMKNQIFR